MPFGEEIIGLGQRSTELGYNSDSVKQKYTGYEKDKESGLDYAQARYYNNLQGRFTGVDPSRKSMQLTKPQTMNRYAYCINNPLKYVDKNGEWPTEWHDYFVKKALSGLSEREIQQIQKGSRRVDTYLGSGTICDFPITMIPSEASKHAMTPPGLTKQDAVKEAQAFVEVQKAKAIEFQKLFEKQFGKGVKGKLSLAALLEFGKGTHTYMDATSPAHRGFQAYTIPTREIVIINPDGTETKFEETDWAKFIQEMLEHKDIEKGPPTTAEEVQTLILIRGYFLFTFGDEQFRRAVPNEKDRKAVYDYMKQQGIEY
jgi:RHS repeat-associated protein